MGIFDKIFEKKICDICGAEIGLLGNKKLENGNCCKTCASKLSPFFNERRTSTVEEIKQQLAYREDNKVEVSKFNITRTIGTDSKKILLDEDARKFVITSARNLQDANPDVIDYSMVTGCDLDIRDRETEVLRKDKEGKMVSYVPARYRCYYDFHLTIFVNHPYFDEIQIKLNNSSVETTPTGGLPANRIPDPCLNSEYNDYVNMAQQIIDILSNIREETRSNAAPKAAVTCPYCGATTIPDKNGCCEFCGGAVN